MPVPTLYQLAKKACIRNISDFDSVGDSPYELVRPILLKLENPDQLRQIEENSPQIIGLDAEIWDAFIRRDIPGYDTKPHKPKNPANYWKVYRKLQRERQEELDRAGDLVKAQMESAAAEKHGNTMQKLELPKRVAPTRRQLNIARAYGRAPPPGTSKPQTFLEKERKKALERGMSKMNMPTHELGNMASKVFKAPASFVADYKHEAARYRPPPNPIRAPRMAVSGSADAPKPLSTPSLVTREDRLRALTGARPTNFSTSRSAAPVTIQPTTKQRNATSVTALNSFRPSSQVTRSVPREQQTKHIASPHRTPAVGATFGTKRPRDDAPSNTASPDPKRLRTTPSISAPPALTPERVKQKSVLGPRPSRASPVGELAQTSSQIKSTSTSPPPKRRTKIRTPQLKPKGDTPTRSLSRSPTPLEPKVEQPKRMVKKPAAASIFMPVKKTKLKSS